MNPLVPLQAGERLQRAEFYRRWGAFPQLKYAERLQSFVLIGIDGLRSLGSARARMCGWLGSDECQCPGVEAGPRTATRITTDD